jgi:NAD(P)-dependent dehydrogenase (short-subunit alcohol dehydrogenase family)
MNLSLSGKTAIVTGASRGIGRATALQLARAGALVAVHFGSNGDAATQVLREIEDAGGHAFLLQADLTSTHEIAAMFESLDKELGRRGVDKVDILVNNAGIAIIGGIETVQEADFDRLFATNVKGLLFVTQHALPRLRDGGRIINMSSMVGHTASPGSIVYGATKAAVDSITLSLAQALGPRKIAVNAVAPGATDTDFIAFLMDDEAMVSGLRSMTAMGEIGKAEDIASVVAMLASNVAGWITGERIRASGGMHL